MLTTKSDFSLERKRVFPLPKCQQIPQIGILWHVWKVCGSISKPLTNYNYICYLFILRCDGKTRIVAHIEPRPPSPALWLFQVVMMTRRMRMVHTVPEQELNISKKMTTMETWTFYSRRLFLFVRLLYYFIAVLRLTKSSTLLSARGERIIRYSNNIRILFE